MGFKKYIVFSVIFIALVYGYAFSLELGTYRASVLDISLNLPVSLWLILPAVFLFLATIIHILFYGLLNIFRQRVIKKDHENMIELIKLNLLEKPCTKKFKSKPFKNLATILNQLNLDIKDDIFTSTDEELNNLVVKLQNIKNGKYVNDKSLKLNEVSTLANQNMINKVNEQIDFAVDVLKKPENYSSNVVRQSFINVLNEKSMTTVKKLYKNIKLDKELALMLFRKDAENNEFGFDSEEISKIVKDLNFEKEDYVILAKNYESILKPDQIIPLFEKLSNESDSATHAYLHVLFEYEMIDKARELVSTTSEDEFTSFKALLDLKDAGKHYDLEAISYK